MVIKGNTKYVQCKLMRKAYPCNQFEVVNHAIGVAITKAITSKSANSLKSNFNMLSTEAPNTLRMPISFVRL